MERKTPLAKQPHRHFYNISLHTEHSSKSGHYLTLTAVCPAALFVFPLLLCTGPHHYETKKTHSKMVHCKLCQSSKQCIISIMWPYISKWPITLSSLWLRDAHEKSDFFLMLNTAVAWQVKILQVKFIYIKAYFTWSKYVYHTKGPMISVMQKMQTMFKESSHKNVI